MEERFDGFYREPDEDHGNKEDKELGIVAGQNEGNDIRGNKGYADCIG
jgi:hypothetical protein